ncbi:MAG: hypothetical protein N2Z76_05560 [Treponemataceae bacterium]|nr:hypothetical protein [Treponemataceae bacterium]
MKYKTYLVLCLFFVFLTFVFCNEYLYSFNDSLDTAVAALVENLGIDSAEFEDHTEEIEIKKIRFIINGTTRENWARSRLFIKENQRWYLQEWQKVARLQADYFLETGLFYNASVYLVPREGEPAFDAVVELTDGFMYTFNFWPWDVTVGVRHLLDGDEFLETTAGLTTQRIFWSHPLVGGTPFSYVIDVGHRFSERKDMWLEDSFFIGGKLYLSLAPAIDLGTEQKFRYILLPNSSILASGRSVGEIQTIKSVWGLPDKEIAGTVGAFVDIWPLYRFMQPLGYHVKVAGGLAYGENRSSSWYGSIESLVFVRPLPQVVAHIFVSGNTVGSDASPLLWPDVSVYRSSNILPLRPTLWRSFFQLTYFSFISIPLGFTRMTVNGYVFLETAGSFQNPYSLKLEELEQSAGGAVAIGFLYPINLYFSFGIQQSLRPDRGMGLLFSVHTTLY